MEPRLEAAHRAEVERKEIKEESPVGFSGERNHLPAAFPDGLVEDPLQIGCLAAQTRAVINDLAVNLAGGEVDEAHAEGLSS